MTFTRSFHEKLRQTYDRSDLLVVEQCASCKFGKHFGGIQSNDIAKVIWFDIGFSTMMFGSIHVFLDGVDCTQGSPLSPAVAMLFGSIHVFLDGVVCHFCDGLIIVARCKGALLHFVLQFLCMC